MPNQIINIHSIYVGDLHPDVNERILHEKFSPMSELLSIRVCRDAVSWKSLGYGYVNFKRREDAMMAIEHINLEQIHGKPCRIMWSNRNFKAKNVNIGNICIRNLEQSITIMEIYDTFVNFGQITSCKLLTNKSQQSKGIAFVQYQNEVDALKAIEVINGKLIRDQLVVVEKFIKQDVKFTNCFIKNFQNHLNDDSLKKLFEPFGEINNAKVMVDKNNKSKGFGFVSFKNHKDALEAVNKLNGLLIEGNPIYVGQAKKASEHNKVKKENDRRVNLYVKNINTNISSERLKEIFTKFGNVTSAVVMVDEESKMSKQFGFVCFSTNEEAVKAIMGMNGQIVDGKVLFVNFAQKKELRARILSSLFH